MKNVDTVGNTNLYALHSGNHNEKGNPHPQYANGENDFTLNPSGAAILGLTIGSGTQEIRRRIINNYVVMYTFRVSFAADTTFTRLGLRVAPDLQFAEYGRFDVGSGIVYDASSGATYPVIMAKEFNSTVDATAMLATSPATALAPGTPMTFAAGDLFNGTVLYRANRV